MRIDEVLATLRGGSALDDYQMINKAQPTPGDVHVNAPLTNISVAFFQDANNFVASKVFPNIPVDKQSNVYYQYDRSFFNRSEMEARAVSSETAKIGYELLPPGTYNAKVYGIHIDIDDQTRANADGPINLDRDATQLLAAQAMLNKEKIFSSSFMATGKWSVDITGVASAPSGTQALQWSLANSTPIEDVRAGKQSVLQNTGMEPNTLVMGKQVYDKLIDHPDIVDRVKYSVATSANPSMANMNTLTQLFEVDRILVMKGIQNTAKEGQTQSNSFFGGKVALLAYVPPSPGLLTPSAGYTFSWTGYLGAQADGQRVRRFRVEPNNSDRIELEQAFDMVKVSGDLGYFFTSIVA